MTYLRYQYILNFDIDMTRYFNPWLKALNTQTKIGSSLIDPIGIHQFHTLQLVNECLHQFKRKNKTKHAKLNQWISENQTK